MSKPSKGWILGYYSGYQHALSEVYAAIQDRKRFYPTDVFRPARPGEAYTSPDGAAAAMARFTCDQAMSEVMKLKNAKFEEIGQDLDFCAESEKFKWKAALETRKDG